MTSPRTVAAAALVLIGLAGGAFFLSQGWHGAPRAALHATVFPMPRPLPEFTLTDHHGDRLTRDTLAAVPHLLFFGFTHCPDICPATLQQLSMARRRLADEGQSPLPDILLISVDPGRDTPARLAEYVAHFGDGVSGATGSIDSLAALAAFFGISFSETTPDEEGNYTVTHSAAVLVLDDSGQLAALFSAPHSVDAFVADLPLILSGT